MRKIHGLTKGLEADSAMVDHTAVPSGGSTQNRDHVRLISIEVDIVYRYIGEYQVVSTEYLHKIVTYQYLMSAVVKLTTCIYMDPRMKIYDKPSHLPGMAGSHFASPQKDWIYPLINKTI